MNTASKLIAVIITGTIIGYISFNTYHYFFDMGYPAIEIKNISQDGHYKGNVEIIISGTDDYKISDISLMLDDQPLLKRHKVNSKKCNILHTIHTSDLTNGKHLLVVTATNGIYAAHQTKTEYTIYIDNEPVHAHLLKQADGFKILQGRTAHIKIQTNKQIKEGSANYANKKFPLFAQSPNGTLYECFIPIACEDKPEVYALIFALEDHVGNSVQLNENLEVLPAQFRRQQLNVDADKIKKEKELETNNDRSEEEIEKLTVLFTC